jgi:hypothetical protein
LGRRTAQLGLSREVTTEEPAPRRLYPAEDDPSVLRVELRLQGVRIRGVALIVTDDRPAALNANSRCGSCSPPHKPLPWHDDYWSS